MQPERIVVAQLAFIGDMVFTTPLLAALRELYPGARITVVGRPSALGVLEDHPCVDATVAYDKERSDAGAGGLFRLGRAVRRERPDLFLGVSRSARTAALAWLSGARLRVGFREPGRRLAYDLLVDRRDAETRLTERPLLLLGPLPGAGPEAARPRRLNLVVRPDRRRAACERLEEAGWQGERLVFVAPGAHYATKRWTEEHVAGFLDLVLARGEFRPVLTGGPEESALIERLLAGRPGVIDDRGGGLSMLAAELTLASAFVGGDSGPTHIARAVGTPAIAIHGPTPADAVHDAGPYHVVSRGLDCQPCSTSGDDECPLGHHRCMREILPEQVYEALRRHAGDPAGQPGAAGPAS